MATLNAVLGQPIVTILGGVQRGGLYKEINKTIGVASVLLATGFALNTDNIFPNTGGGTALFDAFPADSAARAMLSGYTHTDIEGSFLPKDEDSMLFLRMTDLDNYYAIRYKSGNLDLLESVAGVVSTLASVASPSPFPNNNIVFKLTGTALSATILSTTASATDATFASGNIGYSGDIGKIAIK